MPYKKTIRKGTITCDNKKGSCAQGVCECDKAMAICIKKMLDSGSKCPKKFGLGDVDDLVKKMVTNISRKILNL